MTERALALASGGARGAYQAGALLALAEHGERFDRIAGTSIGALNGAFYAQGDGSPGHVGQLCELWRSMPDAGIVQLNGAAVPRAIAFVAARDLRPIVALVNRFTTPAFAILDPRPVAELLDRWLDYDALCSGRRSLLITMLRETEPTVDMLTAPWRSATYFEAAQLGPERVQSALLASAAIPLAFPAQKVERKRYADAALAAPLPAEELHRRGARWITSIFLADSTVQNRADFPDTTLVQIRPSEPIERGGLATVFDFSRDTIERLIDLGYRDVGRTLGEARDLADQMTRTRRLVDDNVRRADALPDRSRRLARRGSDDESP